jgi:hypothetical protein
MSGTEHGGTAYLSKMGDILAPFRLRFTLSRFASRPKYSVLEHAQESASLSSKVS